MPPAWKDPRTPVTFVFLFRDAKELHVGLSEDTEWDFRHTIGRSVDLWIGPDAAFRFECVGFEFTTKWPALILKGVESADAATVDALIRKNPGAQVAISLRPPPHGVDTPGGY